jgi:protein SCO1
MLILLLALPTGSVGLPRDPVGVRDLTGGRLPLDLVFRDDSGAAVTLRDLLDKPAILVPVYYSCEHLCPQVLGRLAEALPRVPLPPGVAYRVLTVSFDGRDTPEDAAAARRNYLAEAGPSFPEAAWQFLTADQATLDRLTETIGLGYLRVSGGFSHPEVLVFLGPGGTITGYLPPGREPSGLTRPLPFLASELALRLEDARAGKTRPAPAGTPVVCFPHERLIELGFFKLLHLFAWLNLAAVAGLFLALVSTGRKRRKDSGG